MTVYIYIEAILECKNPQHRPCKMCATSALNHLNITIAAVGRPLTNGIGCAMDPSMRSSSAFRFSCSILACRSRNSRARLSSSVSVGGGTGRDEGAGLAPGISLIREFGEKEVTALSISCRATPAGTATKNNFTSQDLSVYDNGDPGN